MITRTLFRRNYLIFASIVTLFILIGTAASMIILNAQRKEYAKGPAQFVYRFFLSQDHDPFVALEKIRKIMPDEGKEFELIKGDGTSATEAGKKVISKSTIEDDRELMEKEGMIVLQSNPFSSAPPTIVLKTSKADVYLLFKPQPFGANRGKRRMKRSMDREFGQRPPPPQGHCRGAECAERPPMPPPGFGEPGMGDPMMGPPPDMGNGDFRPPPPPQEKSLYFTFVTLGTVSACVLISLGIALFYLFSKYKKQAEEAFQVLGDIRQGNLSVRMPVQKHNELKPLILAFNAMADDVEGLVDNLKKADQARRHLLQDLAHDLRTPLTSLRTFLEALKTNDKRLSEEKRQEVVNLCFSEVEYFGNLVEDLLFLAQITEPKYSKGTERFNFKEYVEDQIRVFQTRSPDTHFVFHNEHAENAYVTGSSKLIDRALRNAFDNSSSFAKDSVHVTLKVQDQKLILMIEDDGPGFSEKALKEFGYKKASRMLTGPSENARISVGIGSVIMREILNLHGGELHAENRLQDGRVIGGRVSFWLPIS